MGASGNAMPMVRRTLALAAVSALVGAASASTQLGGPPAGVFGPDALRVFVCGSASPLGNALDRAQACIAVIAGERIFLVDVGGGSAKTLALARFPMEHVEGVFLTHYHSDHIADLPTVNLNTWTAGRTQRLTVMGPEGIEGVVAGFNAAYQLDRSYRTLHHGEELLPADIGPMESKSIVPGVVYDSEGLKVTAFPVDHRPIVPAFGYRFDYAGRSVVVSGDTVATPTLSEAAKDADLLLHDALAPAVVKQISGMLSSSGNERTGRLVEDVQDYHAPVGDILQLAGEAGVGWVGLYHLVPVPVTPMILNQFSAGLPENVVVTTDGLLFELERDGDGLEMRQLIER